MLTEKAGRIVAAHKLLRRSRRTETGEFLADGAQAVREAIAAEADRPGTVLEVYVTETAGNRNRDLLRAAFAAGLTVTQVTDRAAAALSDAVHPQGLVARCRIHETPLADVLAAGPRMLAVLVETGDPGNAGTIVRLADATGCDAVVFAGDAVDPFNPKAVRATTGSLFHLPVVRVPDTAQLMAELSSAGLAVMATSGAGDLDLDQVEEQGLLELPTAWLFGSEAHGLPEAVMTAADAVVSVPIYGRAESLNLATAAAVCLYAAARAARRRPTP
ncbi:RNA methyltransferase [Nakamurella sp. YIM 132087]|uniref:RNA methyltransferase n=1 Tax=Nakamurella alba TaxID=2665158 RepID=A0A7K1FIY3_9ACTN|nr:RNA methyltransferase [Nakamurella alba]